MHTLLAGPPSTRRHFVLMNAMPLGAGCHVSHLVKVEVLQSLILLSIDRHTAIATTSIQILGDIRVDGPLFIEDLNEVLRPDLLLHVVELTECNFSIFGCDSWSKPWISSLV